MQARTTLMNLSVGLVLGISLGGCPPRNEPYIESGRSEAEKPKAAPIDKEQVPTDKRTDLKLAQDTKNSQDEELDIKTVAQDENEPGLGIVIATRLNVRKEPKKTNDPVLEVLRCGDIVGLDGTAGQDKDWFRVSSQQTKDGYVYGTYILRLVIGSKRPTCESSRRLRPPSPDEQNKEISKDQAKIGPNPDLAKTKIADTRGPAAPEPDPSPIPDAKPPAAKKEAVVSLPSDPITLDQGGDRGKVTFPHNLPGHQKYKCFRCHHPTDAKGGSAMEDVKAALANDIKRCHNCHTATSKVKATAAFHDTCRDCHRVAAPKKAPIGCDDCHKSK